MQSQSGGRLARYDWDQVGAELEWRGVTTLEGLFSEQECLESIAWYDDARLFRSHVIMDRHGYGQGEYKYFAAPLPPLIELLRQQLYAQLVGIANQWTDLLTGARPYPARHRAFLDMCNAAGQTRPTPLLLRYGPGDYNRLHQDLYGELSFPLQVAVLLNDPARDFGGGELVLTEQKARSQSRVRVVPLKRGDAACFAVADRPARSARGFHRLKVRHGMSELRWGMRHVLGIIFHDAA